MVQSGEKSIIEIIQKMIKAGESEAAIIKTLKELGVDAKKAKRLLLIGEADTFALLKGDISKIVRANVEKEKESLKKFVTDEIEKSSKISERKVVSAVISDLQTYEKDIDIQRQNFREQINSNMSKVTFLSDKVKDKLNELGRAIRQVQIDMDEIKLKGIANRNRFLSSTMIVLGIAFAIIDLYLLMNSFQSTQTSVDSLMIMVLLAMISITMMFVSTLV